MCLAKMSSAWVRHQKGKPDLGARTGGGGGGGAGVGALKTGLFGNPIFVCLPLSPFTNKITCRSIKIHQGRGVLQE